MLRGELPPWLRQPSGTGRLPGENFRRKCHVETGNPSLPSSIAGNATENSSDTLVFAAPDARTVTTLALSEPRDVYCLTVPGLEAFCIEGGLVVHNCMYACLENPVALPTDEDDFDEDDMPEVPARSAHSGLTLGPPIK